MSTIKLNGTTSGSSIIKAPDSGSTNQTFTLPASSGTLVTTTDAGVAGITSAADATAITINSSENVGIGQTSPSYRLHVETSVDGDFASLIHNTDADNGQGLMIRAGADSGEAILSLRNQASSEKFKVLADGRGLSQFTAKFWCKFNGSGTLAVNDSHNVSSVTDVGTGDYRVNFANAMGNAHYSVHVQSQTTATWTGQWDNIHSTVTSYVGFDHKEGGTNTDTGRVNVLGFGD